MYLCFIADTDGDNTGDYFETEYLFFEDDADIDGDGTKDRWDSDRDNDNVDGIIGGLFTSFTVSSYIARPSSESTISP